MRRGQFLRALLGCTALIVTWIVASRSASPLLPAPWTVADALIAVAVEGRLGTDVEASVMRVALGLLIAAGLVVALCGVALVLPGAGDIVAGPIELVRPVPPIAWVPVTIMLFGVSGASAVAIVTVGAFFPMWLSSIASIAGVRRAHVLAARSLGAGPRHLLVGVVVPSILPSVLHGVRLGVGMGWFSVVAAEMMGAPSGLGQGIQLYSMNLQMAQLYAYIAVVGLIGFALNALLVTLHRRASHWQTIEGWRDV